MAYPSLPSPVFSRHESDIMNSSGRQSILIQEGKRARRQESTVSFPENKETIIIPEPSPEDMPEFCDEEERARAIASAKEIAEAALTEDSDGTVEKASAPCFACCAAPPETPADEEEEEEPVELTEEVVEKMSSRKLNSIIERRLTREMSRTLSKEESFQIDKGIVSFGTFLTVKSVRLCSDRSRPVPLVNYLPPSPLFTFDGKLGVNCMAFQLDFTDKLKNIVPPFFLRDEETLDERAQQILERGVSYAKSIDMFGTKDLDFLNQEEPPSAAHMDLLKG